MKLEGSQTSKSLKLIELIRFGAGDPNSWQAPSLIIIRPPPRRRNPTSPPRGSYNKARYFP
jgi:hypothetical protein